MFSKTSRPPVIVAKAIPPDIASPSALDEWLEKQKLHVGTVEQIPEPWVKILEAFGCLARLPGQTQIVRLPAPRKDHPLDPPNPESQRLIFLTSVPAL